VYEKKLSIPCIDAICNPSDADEKDACIAEIRKCMEIASNLHIPNIRLRANATENEDDALANTAAVIAELLPEAESRGVTLLMETASLFAKSAIHAQLRVNLRIQKSAFIRAQLDRPLRASIDTCAAAAAIGFFPDQQFRFHSFPLISLKTVPGTPKVPSRSTP
jgi:sugar phosphate isomerase/epimerase